MYRKSTFALLLVLGVVLVCGGVDAQEGSKRRVKMVEGTDTIPLRVVARAGALLYTVPEDGEENINPDRKVATFEPFYVYGTKDLKKGAGASKEGWYEVGTDDRGTVTGWFKAADAIEWKTTMVLAFEAKQEGRERLLMFADRKELRDLATSPLEERKAKATAVYGAVAESKQPEGAKIVAMEPKMEVDINKQFYLIPIIDHFPIELEGTLAEGRLIKIAVAVGEAANRNPGGGEVASNEDLKELNLDVDSAGADVLKDMAIDIVFVADMTNSMQPFLTATFNSIRDISASVTKDPNLVDKVRFGLWGYRDSLEIPGMDFVTKNFTPELQSVVDFEKTLASAKACRAGSQGYAEDVYAGVHGALTQSAWTKAGDGSQGSLRFIVLMGDAPAHEPGDQWNSSQQSAESLATFGEEKSIYTIALHIKDPDAGEYHALTESQFRTLARNRNQEGQAAAAYYPVDARNPAEFEAAAKGIADVFIEILKQAQKGQVAEAPPAAPAPGAPAGTKVEDIAIRVGHTAQMRWMGQKTGTPAPSDVLAWVTDRDLMDPDMMVVQPRVLFKKTELSELREKLKMMVRGIREAEGVTNFFEDLQGGVTGVFKGEGAEGGDKADLSDLLYLLPYQSQVLAMTSEMWGAMSADDRQQFVDEIQAKMEFYKAMYDDIEQWTRLNPEDEPGDHVCPIPLDMLP